MTVRERWCTALARLGLTRDQVEAVAGEVWLHCGWRGERGALEWEDLWGAAALAVWDTRVREPNAQGGLLRLRVRWAIRDVLRAEEKAHGKVRLHGARKRARDPAVWPRCACGATVKSERARYCGSCVRARHREQDRACKQRAKQTEAAA